MIVGNRLSFLSPVIVGDLMRFGKDHDGGYIIPTSLVSRSDCLLSFGVEWDWSFEVDFKRFNRRVAIIAFDHSVSPKDIIMRVPKSLVKVLLRRRTASQTLRDILDTFNYFRVMKHHVRKISPSRVGPKDITINDVFDLAKDYKNIFLKMDIEGSEYEVFNDILSKQDQIIGFVIEFHSTDTQRDLFVSTIGRLLENYEIVHLHGNNYCPVARDGLPQVLEITLMRKEDLKEASVRRKTLPLSLDQPCDPLRPDIQLQFET